jgi:DNA repair protein RadC
MNFKEYIDKPREKLKEGYVLSEVELLAIILEKGYKGKI